ncbi:MAG: substrate-binding domain-containing protein, partial [Micromonosporaceae bacterium]|nr:substrate-binding domain-containing protein [Micromonosporaceae bacterium]
SAVSGSAADLTERLATVAASGSPAGFIVIPQWSGHDGFARTLADLGTPVVPVNARAAGGPAPGVTADQAGGITQLVGHLAGLGHERIGYLAGPAGHNDADARLEAFYRAAAALGLRVPAPWVHRVPFTIAGGETGLRTLLGAAAAADTPRPTAILAADDYVAAGALRHAASLGLAIPADLSIVGFDDVDVARATVPALTTVRQPLWDLGYAAAEQVLKLLDGHCPDPVALPGDLVVRDSSATLPDSRR